MCETLELREQLAEACTSLQESVHAFKVWCKDTNWDQNIINITEEFTEIFTNVFAKVSFSKEDGSKIISIRAKAGSNVAAHKMLPNRFIYVVHGENRNEAGVIILNEDEGMQIKPLQELSMYFPVDTKLIMEIEAVNEST